MVSTDNDRIETSGHILYCNPRQPWTEKCVCVFKPSCSVITIPCSPYPVYSRYRVLFQNQFLNALKFLRMYKMGLFAVFSILRAKPSRISRPFEAITSLFLRTSLRPPHPFPGLCQVTPSRSRLPHPLFPPHPKKAQKVQVPWPAAQCFHKAFST